MSNRLKYLKFDPKVQARLVQKKKLYRFLLLKYSFENKNIKVYLNVKAPVKAITLFTILWINAIIKIIKRQLIA